MSGEQMRQTELYSVAIELVETKTGRVKQAEIINVHAFDEKHARKVFAESFPAIANPRENAIRIVAIGKRIG